MRLNTKIHFKYLKQRFYEKMCEVCMELNFCGYDLEAERIGGNVLNLS